MDEENNDNRTLGIEDIGYLLKEIKQTEITPDNFENFQIKVDSAFSHINGLFQRLTSDHDRLNEELIESEKKVKEVLKGEETGGIPVPLYKKKDHIGDIKDKAIEQLVILAKLLKAVNTKYNKLFNVNRALNIQSEVLNRLSEENKVWFSRAKEQDKINKEYNSEQFKYFIEVMKQQNNLLHTKLYSVFENFNNVFSSFIKENSLSATINRPEDVKTTIEEPNSVKEEKNINEYNDNIEEEENDGIEKDKDSSVSDIDKWKHDGEESDDFKKF